MFDYLKDFEPVFMLLLGWSMGLISPTIIEEIRRRYRRRDLIQAVVDELVGLQYTMAFVALKHRSRNAEVTDDFLDALLPVIESYAGPDRDEAGIAALRRLRERPEDQRRMMYEAMREQNKGLVYCVKSS